MEIHLYSEISPGKFLKSEHHVNYPERNNLRKLASIPCQWDCDFGIFPIWRRFWTHWRLTSHAWISRGIFIDELSSYEPLKLILLKVFGFRAPKTPLGWNLTTDRQQLLSSLMTLGAFVSSGGAGFMAIKLGRKQCLWIGCVLCFISNIIMMTTEDIHTLYGGRFLNGLANGFFMTFSQLYIQESSPAKYRGLFLTAFQFCTSFVSQLILMQPYPSSYSFQIANIL